jgi:phosphohistidine phosphatase
MTKSAPDLRHLFLLRHAHAVHAGPKLADIDRPLSDRGHRQAEYIAKRLEKVAIDYVLCSSSTRTRQTVNPILQTRCDAMPTVVYDKNLYGAEAETLLEIVATVPTTATSVLLVGHNPAMEELVGMLKPKGGTLPDGFPKGACIHLTTSAAWDSIAGHGTKVAGYDCLEED